MADAERTQADQFIEHQEHHERGIRCGEPVAWTLEENLEARVQMLLDFEGQAGERIVYIPNDPFILSLLMTQMRERVLEECEGRA